MVTTSKSKTKSILHDIIKSCINYYPFEIMDICRGIQTVKNSNILNKGYWIFEQSRQEQININWRQADAVWFYTGQKQDTYFIVHEIKTGSFNIEEIYKKYHTGMNLQIWIWAFNKKILENPQRNFHKSVKIIPINSIAPFIKSAIEMSDISLLEMCMP